MKLHEKIRHVRKAKGISQKHIAKTTGMTTSSYNMKENGKRIISTDEIESIAIALDVKPTLFFEEKFHFTWNVNRKEVI